MEPRNHEIRRYLLGQLEEPAREELELRMEDDLFYQHLLAAEDDLIDGYLAGELGTDERQWFERCFLVSERRQQRLEISRRLVAAAEHRKRRLPKWRSAAAAVAASVLLMGGIYAWRQGLEVEPERAGSTAPTLAEEFLTLELGVSRGGEIPRLPLPAVDRATRLRILVDPADLETPLEILLRNPLGEVVWQGAAVRAGQDPGVEIELPPGRLVPGLHEVEVRPLAPGDSIEPLGFVYFELAEPS